MGINTGLEAADVHTGLLEDAPGQTVLLQQRQQQVLRLQLLMLGRLRQVLGSNDGGPGLFGELLRRRLHDRFRLN